MGVCRGCVSVYTSIFLCPMTQYTVVLFTITALVLCKSSYARGSQLISCKNQIVLPEMRKGQMLRTTPGLRRHLSVLSVGVEIRKKGSFGVSRAKNGVILCETAQNFLSLTFKSSCYIKTFSQKWVIWCSC